MFENKKRIVFAPSCTHGTSLQHFAVTRGDLFAYNAAGRTKSKIRVKDIWFKDRNIKMKKVTNTNFSGRDERRTARGCTACSLPASPRTDRPTERTTVGTEWNRSARVAAVRTSVHEALVSWLGLSGELLSTVVQRRRGACWDAGTRRLALSGEPTSKKRAVADEVVEKSQLSCLILPINTGSELFSRVGCWDAGTRRLAVSGEPTSKQRGSG